jgi:hypothetical protein
VLEAGLDAAHFSSPPSADEFVANVAPKWNKWKTRST